MSYERKRLGNEGEDCAAEILIVKGYKILGRQVRTRIGEIDLLAQDGNDLVVVEVKTKTDSLLGTPEEMVDWKKQRKLIRLSRCVNQRFPNFGIRIDVVAIEGDDVRHYVNAVQDEH
jgi:putative endonuclease